MGVTWGHDDLTMVFTQSSMKFMKPTGSNYSTCAPGFTLATSYGIEATTSWNGSHMYGSIAHMANSSYVMPQQWAPVADVKKATTTHGDKMTECVQGFPQVVNGYTGK